MNDMGRRVPDEWPAVWTIAALLDALDALTALIADRAAAADAAGDIAPGLELLRSSGLATAALTPEEGGLDVAGSTRVQVLCDVLRRLGAADLSLARLFEGHVNAVALVGRYGTAEQVAVFATAIRDGALSGVWAADGAHALRADRDGGAIRLHGRKIMASGAGLIARPLVTASTPEGPILILLDLFPGERADTAMWTAQGMRASATGVIDLDGTTVRHNQVIGVPGDFLRQPHLSGGAWRFCAAHLGAAERLVDHFRDHLVARKRDADPYQIQRVAHCVTATTTAAFWIEDAARRLASATEEASDEIVAFANLTRMVTEHAALDVLDAVQRGTGLSAFLRPHPIERIGRDLATYLRQPAPDLAMADAARAVLASPHPTASLWRTR